MCLSLCVCIFALSIKSLPYQRDGFRVGDVQRLFPEEEFGMEHGNQMDQAFKFSVWYTLVNTNTLTWWSFRTSFTKCCYQLLIVWYLVHIWNVSRQPLIRFFDVCMFNLFDCFSLINWCVDDWSRQEAWQEKAKPQWKKYSTSQKDSNSWEEQSWTKQKEDKTWIWIQILERTATTSSRAVVRSPTSVFNLGLGVGL